MFKMFFLVVFLSFSLMSLADSDTRDITFNDTSNDTGSIRYLVPDVYNSPLQIKSALLRAKTLLNHGLIEHDEPPVVFVLHGPEANIFLRENYAKYREIVDLAAQLTAFNVIDVRVCQNRLSRFGSEVTDLVPFVGTVPNGPVEVKRLLEKEEYIYF